MVYPEDDQQQPDSSASEAEDAVAFDEAVAPDEVATPSDEAAPQTAEPPAQPETAPSPETKDAPSPDAEGVAQEDGDEDIAPDRELSEDEMAQAAVNLERCEKCAHLDGEPTEEGLLRCAAHKMLMKPERNEMPDDCVRFSLKK